MATNDPFDIEVLKAQFTKPKIEQSDFTNLIDGAIPSTITDPGDGGTVEVPPTSSFILPITALTASDERTLPDPKFVGQKAFIYAKDLGTRQVETVEVVGTITQAGNATVIVTAAGMTNSPKTKNVAVAEDDDADTIATKIWVACVLDVDIAYHPTTGLGFFNVDQSPDPNANILTFTASTVAADDATMNISVENGTCLGITDDTTSTDTTAGVVGSLAITASSPINAAGNTIMTFDAIGDAIKLEAVEKVIAVGHTALIWRVIANDGVTLS